MIGCGLISPTLTTGHHPAWHPSSGTLSRTDLTLNGSFQLASFFCGDLPCLVWEMAPDPVEFLGLPDHGGVGKG